MKNDIFNEVINDNCKSCAYLTVQCLGETKIASHEDTFQHHIENAKDLGLMPDDMKVIKKTLSDYGFLMQSTRVEDIGFRDMVSFLANHLDAPAIALLSLGGHMVAMRFDETHGFSIFCPEPRPKYWESRRVSHVWIRFDDGVDRSPFLRKEVKRRSSSPKSREVKDAECYRFYNPNPCGNFIGDCVVRAFSGALSISWKDSLDRLASSDETTVNAQNVYPKVLEKEGFAYHKPLSRNGRRLTGKEFFTEMDRLCRNGERIFAHCGRSHVVAIVPVDGHYVIKDSWNSSSRTIGEFWTKSCDKPKMRPKVEKMFSEPFSVGDRLNHPVFGAGTVIAVLPGVVTIDFGEKGLRRLGSTWVSKNCIRMAA